MLMENKPRLGKELWTHSSPREKFAALFHVAISKHAPMTLKIIAEGGGKDVRRKVNQALRREHGPYVHGSMYIDNSLVNGIFTVLGIVDRQPNDRYSYLITPEGQVAVKAAEIATAYLKYQPSTDLPLRTSTSKVREGELFSRSFLQADLLLHLGIKHNLSGSELMRFLGELNPHVPIDFVRSLENITLNGLAFEKQGIYELTQKGQELFTELLQPLASLAGYEPI